MDEAAPWRSGRGRTTRLVTERQEASYPKMYVCVCNAYREADVRKAAAEGADTVELAYSILGRRPRCGRCVPVAQALIDGVCNMRVEAEGAT